MGTDCVTPLDSNGAPLIQLVLFLALSSFANPNPFQLRRFPSLVVGGFKFLGEQGKGTDTDGFGGVVLRGIDSNGDPSTGSSGIDSLVMTTGTDTGIDGLREKKSGCGTGEVGGERDEVVDSRGVRGDRGRDTVEVDPPGKGVWVGDWNPLFRNEGEGGGEGYSRAAGESSCTCWRIFS